MRLLRNKNVEGISNSAVNLSGRAERCALVLLGPARRRGPHTARASMRALVRALAAAAAWGCPTRRARANAGAPLAVHAHQPGQMVESCIIMSGANLGCSKVAVCATVGRVKTSAQEGLGPQQQSPSTVMYKVRRLGLPRRAQRDSSCRRQQAAREGAGLQSHAARAPACTCALPYGELRQLQEMAVRMTRDTPPHA